MGTIQIPDYWFALDPEDAGAVESLFRKALASLPMSHAELASELDVKQPTVSRWLRGDTRPDSKKMLHAVTVVGRRLAEIQARVEHARRVLLAVQEAVTATDESLKHTGYSKKKMKAADAKAAKVHRLLEGGETGS